MSPLKSLSSISFNGPLRGVGAQQGYGYAAVQLIQAWQNLGVPVWWGKEESPIAFSFGQPQWYEWQREDQIKIGYTPWESTSLPLGWADKMNQMDEIWTTSNACKEWFINNGVKVNVRVLHHGVNVSHFAPRQRKITDDGRFRFLHIGEPAIRKGGRLVYEAFASLYADDPRYSLTLKGNPTFDIEISNVELVRDRISQEALLKLYHDHHAFVYPSNGEGFGFLPFQAAATGMPTLVTDWSGPQDYMEYCWPIKVKQLIPCDYEPHEGMWALPDIDSLMLNMQMVAEAPHYYFSRAFRNAQRMPAKWSWEKIGKLSLEWMQDLLGS